MKSYIFKQKNDKIYSNKNHIKNNFILIIKEF